MLKKIILVLLIWGTMRYGIAGITMDLIPSSNLYTPGTKLDFLREYSEHNRLMWSWANLDGSNYVAIAIRGYTTAEFGFFPLYPAILRGLRSLVIVRYALIGQAVSFACIIAAFYFCIKLLELDKPKANKVNFIIVCLMFPTAYYWGAAYNDSLFFFLATATLYFGRKKMWLWACVSAFFATLARLNGLALSAFLLFEAWSQLTKNPQLVWRWPTVKEMKKMLPYVIIASVPVAALITYLVYIQYAFGNWDLLFTSMSAWGQDKMIFPLQTVYRYIKIFLFTPHIGLSYWIAWLEFLSVVLYCVVLWFSYKKIRFSYWMFMFIALLIPSLTGTFQGMPRYALHLYPLFLFLFAWVEKQSENTKWVVGTLAVILQIVLITFYINGYFVA